jgi:hypothetical protein
VTESLHLFSTKKDLIEYVYEWFRKYHVLKDEHKLKELVHEAFNSGLFKLEKETFYCLKVDLNNRKKFYDSLISEDHKMIENLETNDFIYVSKGLENNGAVHGIDTKNIIEVELNKLETFEQLFFNLFLKARQKIDEAFLLYYSSTPPKEEHKLRYRKAIGLLNELLDIFYEMKLLTTQKKLTHITLCNDDDSTSHHIIPCKKLPCKHLPENSRRAKSYRFS